MTDHLVSDPTKSVNLADSDVAEPVQQLIDAAGDLARPSSVYKVPNTRPGSASVGPPAPGRDDLALPAVKRQAGKAVPHNRAQAYMGCGGRVRAFGMGLKA